MVDLLRDAEFSLPVAATHLLRFQRLIRMLGEMTVRAVPTMPASTFPLVDLPIRQIPHHPQGDSYGSPKQDCFECFVKASHHVDVVMPSISASAAQSQCAFPGN